MANSTSTGQKAAVTTRRFAFVPLTVDNATTLTYGDVTEFDKILISVKRTPKQNTASQYASGQRVDSYVAKAGGQLDVGIVGLTGSDEELLFGCDLDDTSGVVSSNKDDVVPYGMVIYSTANSDGTINLYKVMKAKFTDGGDSTETSDESGNKYQTTNITATYEALLKTGDEVCEIKNLDVSDSAGQAKETAWFGSATGGLPSANYS